MFVEKLIVFLKFYFELIYMVKFNIVDLEEKWFRFFLKIYIVILKIVFEF